MIVDESFFFDTVAHIAFELTSRNEGSELDIHDIDVDAREAKLTEAIVAARHCGLIAQDDVDPDIVRFDHHRYQEFFAAAYIQAKDPAVDWQKVVDNPQWQEILINLAAFGGGSRALGVLLGSISDDSRLALHGSTRGGVDQAIQEMLISDRVELASRAIREGRSQSSQWVAEALPIVTQAIINLARTGNPSTQVKMMWAAQNLPEIDLRAVLDTPLDSQVSWVREQALITSMSLGGSRRVQEANIVDEIGMDLASNTFLKRSRAYYRAVSRTLSPRAWWGLAAAWSLSLLSISLFAGMVSFAVWQVGQKEWWLTTPQALIIIVTAVCAGLIEIHFRREHMLGFAILSSGGIAIGACVLLQQAYSGTFPMPDGLVAAFSIVFLGFFVLQMTSVVLTGAALVLYVLLTPYTSLRKRLRDIFKAFDETNNSLMFIIIPAAFCGMLAVSALMAIVVFPAIFGRLSDTGLLVLLVYLWDMVVSAVSVYPWDVVTVFGLAISAIVLGIWTEKFPTLIGMLVIAHTGATLRRYHLEMTAGTWIVYLLVATSIFVVSTLLLYRVRIWWRRRRLRARSGEARFYDPDAWVGQFTKADQHDQSAMLRNVSHQALGLTPGRFHEVLVGIESAVRGEPAQSAYWAARHQLERVLRQSKSES